MASAHSQAALSNSWPVRPCQSREGVKEGNVLRRGGLFDPRGVASRTPVQCFASFADELGFFANLPPLPAHAESLVAADFFSVDTVFFKRLYVLIYVHLATRRILLASCTAEPNTPWVTQQAYWFGGG